MPAGFEFAELTIDRDGTWRRGPGPFRHGPQGGLVLAAGTWIERADVVFPAVHGRPARMGPRGVVRPHAQADGRPPARSARHGKWATPWRKAVGIRTPRPAGGGGRDDSSSSRRTWWWPASAGSSFVSPWHATPPSGDALRCGGRFDDRILIEDVVPGREIDVAVLREADGRRWASPPLEIQTNGLFDTQSKYDGSARFSVPADIDSADRAALTGAALRMFDGSAAPVSPASTSSSPTTDPSSTKSTPCRE